MAPKQKKQAAVTDLGRNTLCIYQYADEKEDDARAKSMLQPAVQAATVIRKLTDQTHDINSLVGELSKQIEQVNGGDMKRMEGMLVAQAHTLDELFAHLARRSHNNMGAGFTAAAETYMRLALRAQGQCRTTIEALSAIKNPPVIYAKQANFANGHQQINNAPLPQVASEVTHTLAIENEQNKLGDSLYELHPNPRTLEPVSRAMSSAEAVGQINRAED